LPEGSGSSSSGLFDTGCSPTGAGRNAWDVVGFEMIIGGDERFFAFSHELPKGDYGKLSRFDGKGNMVLLYVLRDSVPLHLLHSDFLALEGD